MEVMRMGRWREGVVAVVSREAVVEVSVEVEQLKVLLRLLVMVASVKVGFFSTGGFGFDSSG